MTGSAKQSIMPLAGSWIASSLSLLATTRIAYRFDFRFFELFLFFGTLAPDLRASDNPIAIACLRLLTLRPERPLFSVPFLRFFIARLTLLDAFFEYFRAIIISPVARN
jgi:hypothetical protein